MLGVAGFVGIIVGVISMLLGLAYMFILRGLLIALVLRFGIAGTCAMAYFIVSMVMSSNRISWRVLWAFLVASCK